MKYKKILKETKKNIKKYRKFKSLLLELLPKETHLCIDSLYDIYKITENKIITLENRKKAIESVLNEENPPSNKG